MLGLDLRPSLKKKNQAFHHKLDQKFVTWEVIGPTKNLLLLVC